MPAPLLNDVYKFRAALGIPSEFIDAAKSRYGEIPTYFSKYRNPVGIELEIENVSSTFRNLVVPCSLYWNYVEDPSLKHHGAEFRTVPIAGANIDYAIKEFADLAKNEEHLYSVRTSTHVHVNVCFLTQFQLNLLISLSALFEPLLFQMCKPERKHNPFCYSILNLSPEELFSYDEGLKYCGINPAPVSKYVSLEYRFLHGTDDWRLVRRWVQLLCKLYYYVKSNPEEKVITAILEAVKGDHLDLVKKVFGASSILFENPHAIPTASKQWAATAIIRARAR